MFADTKGSESCDGTHNLIAHNPAAGAPAEALPLLSHSPPRDATRDLIAALEHALRGVEACRDYRDGADDAGIRAFQARSEAIYAELAAEGRRLLRETLNREDMPYGRFGGSGANGRYAIADKL